jgi:hypothetical protein
MVKFHTVSLSDGERAFLQRTISAGTAPARVTTRARVLLKADTGPAGPGWEDATIADAVEVRRRGHRSPHPSMVPQPRSAAGRRRARATARLTYASGHPPVGDKIASVSFRLPRTLWRLVMRYNRPACSTKNPVPLERGLPRTSMWINSDMMDGSAIRMTFVLISAFHFCILAPHSTDTVIVL